VSPGQNAGDARKGEKTEGVSKALPLSQMTFIPFVCSIVDGLLGCEAKTFAKCLATKLATKWQHPYSQTCGYINACL
jgi:hypothetical protein